MPAVRNSWAWRFGLLAASALAAAAGCREPAAPERPLRLVFSQPPETLDPQRHQEDLTRAVLANFYEGLVDLDRNLQVRPRLALDWTTPSETVWRFRLRGGVVFHDGSPFGPEDVARTVERARTLPGSKAEADIRSIVSVRAVGAHTVELVTDRPRPLLLYRLAGTPILPRTTGDAPIERPVGTGPYRFAGTAGRISGARFDAYWGPRPAFASFTLDAVAGEAERRDAAATADVVYPFPREVPNAAAARFRVVTHPTVTSTFLVCRIAALKGGAASPFADARVRRALSLAVDREALVLNALAGGATPSWQLAPPGVFGYVPDLPRTARDPAAGRRLLREAGFPKGLASSLWVSPRGEPSGREIARQAAAAGLALTVVVKPWRELFLAMASGEAPLALASWTLASGDASGLFGPVLHAKGGEAGFGEENTSGYANRALDAAVEEAAVTLETTRRGVLLAEMTRLALEELPLVPLYVPTEAYGVRAGLRFSPRLDMGVFASEIAPE